MSHRGRPAASLFPLLLVTLLAILSYWIEQVSRAPAPGRDGKMRHDPDYLVERFTVRRFDAQGNLQHSMTAQRMQHYPDDDSTVVLAPQLIYHRQPQTEVRAREAHIDNIGKRVELIDDVRVVRSGAEGRPDTVLTTARLDVWPDDEIASTHAPVLIAQGLSRIQGSGLSIDNKASFYVLEGPVQGVFFRQAVGGAASPAAPSGQISPTVKTAQSNPLRKPRIRPARKPKATPKTRHQT